MSRTMSGFTDFVRSPTRCMGTLDMQQLTYSDDMVPIYKGTRMTQETTTINQGSYGQVSEWSCVDGGSKVSVIVKIIDKEMLAQKYVNSGRHSPEKAIVKATKTFDAAVNGIEVALTLRAWDLVHFAYWEG